MPTGIYLRKSLRQRFNEKYKISSNGCWIWTACFDEHGYGMIGSGKKNGKHRHSPSHRISWELYRGVIPKGIYVLHKCDNPACVNPSHLFLGTQLDNMHDCIKKGRGIVNRLRKMTHCHKGHPFSGYNLRIQSKGERVCRACERESGVKYRQRKKERRLLCPTN